MPTRTARRFVTTRLFRFPLPHHNTRRKCMRYAKESKEAIRDQAERRRQQALALMEAHDCMSRRFGMFAGGLIERITRRVEYDRTGTDNVICGFGVGLECCVWDEAMSFLGGLRDGPALVRKRILVAGCVWRHARPRSQMSRQWFACIEEITAHRR